MVLLQMQVVDLGLVGRVPALLADVHLGAAFFVGVLVLHPMHLQAVGLQRAPLGERLLAQVALVGSYAWNQTISKQLATQTLCDHNDWWDCLHHCVGRCEAKIFRYDNDLPRTNH
jgi:hypothetical protein